MNSTKSSANNLFLGFSLKSELVKAIKEMGFNNPTPIQTKVIPHLMSSEQDLIASAQTGTGKTAAFGLPILDLTNINDKNVQTLILCPTRELCIQITNDLISYSKYLKKIHVLAVYGGAKIEKQIRALKKEPQIIVGTPGRTKDLIRRKKLNVRNIKRMILDEADEMLSMGFKEDLENIFKATSKEKQILLFSATMTSKVTDFTKHYMQNSLEIAVARMNTAAKNVQHIFYMVQAKDRYEVVKRIADMNPNIYGIVFCRTRRETKDVAIKLMNDHYNADTIHGDLSQPERDDVMRRFRKRQLQILVATDVAARGLDVNDLTHVINYNLPDDDEIYIHRSGRTGRAGRKGVSMVIIHGREIRKLKDIEKTSGISFIKQQVPNGLDICQKRLYALIDKIEKVKVNEEQIEQFLPYIYDKLNWLEREQLIKHFVSAEFNRYLSYYKNSKDINVQPNEKGENKRKRRNRKKFFNSKNKRNRNRQKRRKGKRVS
ncbi:MAG: DEAD/DEAH box helicase [Candidatus Marinimicrobia bacterium]|nr:DEAD/DEAH box helicase [Candidatus Neomarinimicrobiota bacterium]|tara:strand:- start:739 stop:2205 length:1467 start_codon:yes stop_codon:yes gene_type:complete